MTISIDYDPRQRCAILTAIDKNEWHWGFIVNSLFQQLPEIYQSQESVIIPIDMFLSVRVSIAQYAKNHNVLISLTPAIREYLRKADQSSYSTAIRKAEITEDEIKSKLKSVGFIRELTKNQLANLSKIGNLPAAATFSVPGAGKTTEALAYFFLNSEETDKLLVVAPKNAFGAWDEQLSECLGDNSLQFVRLRGGVEKIERALRDNPRFCIITYQQYPRVAEQLMQYIRRNSVFMFLDESHRIKSGRSGISAESILKASFLPKRKLIMSGTPMPQSLNDILPQFAFLYPDKHINDSNAIDLIAPIYVRTTSSQLGIPAIEHRKVVVSMSPLQRELYSSIKSEAKRQIIPLLSDLSKASLRDINKKIIKVMQFVSNPSLLAKDVDYIFDPQLGDVLAKENGPKIDYVCARTRQLVSEGKKVLLWSQFVENVELLAERLKDLGADFIHGGVDAGDEDENDTREWKIKEFHKNPDKMVLVANPAAASEGISLHRVCQYAIYLDRSFNAAHYLQSEDRIHRLGLRPDQVPIIEIVECENSIDQLIAHRLESKISVMAQALNDSSIHVSMVDFDVDCDMDNDDSNISESDIEAIKRYFSDIAL